MNLCPNCGASLPPGQPACPRCGAPLPPPPAGPVYAQPPAFPGRPQ
ncbi:MAG: zinc-ribbon domain-containing protein, partial [Acutalibacter sp.]|nr:zinc-ribbon domain-containing protein [Acutalibacter sp.]